MIEKAISLESEQLWDAYLRKGMACASLDHDQEAQAALEKSLEMGLPPVLLAPLSWLKHEKPDFYQRYVSPLLAQL